MDIVPSLMVKFIVLDLEVYNYRYCFRDGTLIMAANRWPGRAHEVGLVWAMLGGVFFNQDLRRLIYFLLLYRSSQQANHQLY